MKLLPKKEIDTQKAKERKMQIDEGMALAKSVDKLREAKLNEEKSLREWREGNIKKVRYEIDQFIEERDKLEQQNNEARQVRDILIKECENLKILITNRQTHDSMPTDD